MSKTTVVNVRTDTYDVYIGRGREGRLPNFPEYGWLGNPIAMKGEEERGAAIAVFRTYFHERLRWDVGFRDAVMSLKGKRLGCFCAPKPCHGDVIVEWLDKA